VVEWHVDKRRVAAGRQCRRPVGDVLPLRAPWFVEVDVRIDSAREDVESSGVNFLTVAAEVRSDVGDAVARDCDVSLDDAKRCHDRTPADDHCFARSSRKRLSTSSATATSSVVTDSAGLWLTPPLQRTNSIPTSVSEDITTASCPAPLVSSNSCCRQSLTACARRLTSRGEHRTAGFDETARTSTDSLRRRAVSRARASSASATLVRTPSSAWRTSRLSAAWPGITLAAPGSTSSLPTVAT